MVEYSGSLDQVFSALGDTTRRSMVMMLLRDEQLRITDLAAPFSMSTAAVSKHVSVLERAGMVSRTKRGREVLVQINAVPLARAQDWLRAQEQYWTAALGDLDALIRQDLS